ncbi:sensor histidine kinase [Chitinophaga tropicalis]|uniref:Signal transduction histidine kinase internal region domain-containing protein n=1 Tax=Chitinophaga tropicalis TaxID=2683588 RepID=A0A7K1UD73_9BACT|nr:sensor histidine kinase [Chitinophaga tropicalis]MVT12327.1 hypothetical protein [Chitinophaga tropicalis]
MLKKFNITFPVVLELLIWILYAAIYKYSYHLDHAQLPWIPGNDFPYLQLCLFSVCSTLYLVPYYRWALPELVARKKYLALSGLTIIYFALITGLNNSYMARLFAVFTEDVNVHAYFMALYRPSFRDLNLVFLDFIAFAAIGFARFSYRNEARLYKAETDNLRLQLNLLKVQLQPHFLFNTLNSLYGMSLTAPREQTSRYILLLSQLMQHILYDGAKEYIDLDHEISFMQNYFELEQIRYPKSSVVFNIRELNKDTRIPPMLFLPLIENSFKHGKHKIADDAAVEAELFMNGRDLVFSVKNDILDKKREATQGIGLINIRERLELYYPGRSRLLLQEQDGRYYAEVIIKL